MSIDAVASLGRQNPQRFEALLGLAYLQSRAAT